MPRRAPSSATWRHSPPSAAFVVSYAGMRVPGRNARDRRDEHDRAAVGHQRQRGAAQRGSARARSPRARRPTPRPTCPSSPRPSPMPTLHTSAVETAERAHAPRRRSARTRPRRSRRRRSLSPSRPPASTSARRLLGGRRGRCRRTRPPRLLARRAPRSARPLPIGASGSSDGRVPAPTTSTAPATGIIRRARRTSRSVRFAPMPALEEVAPAFVEMAHRIVWCSVATVDHQGRPRSRILHPLWEWDGARSRAGSRPGRHRRSARTWQHSPYVSCSYWTDNHDTCIAECRAEWHFDDETRIDVWNKFKSRACAGRLRPRDHPRLDKPDGRRVRGVAARAVAPARLSRHGAARGGAATCSSGRDRRRVSRGRRDATALAFRPDAGRIDAGRINAGASLRGACARCRGALAPRGTSASRRREHPSRP